MSYGVVAGGPLGAPRERPGGRSGSGRSYAGDGRRNGALAMAGYLCDGGVLVAGHRAEAGRGRGVSGSGGGQLPATSDGEFRRRHLADFKELFVAVVRLAQELGLARFGKLSIDGTKVRANASKRKAMSYGRMAKEERRLTGEIEALLPAARPTWPRTRGWGRTCGATSCRRSCAAGKTVWRRSAAKSRLEAQQRAAADACGRQPDQDRNPKGGQPYKRSYGEARRRRAGPGERGHARTGSRTTRRWRSMVSTSW